MSWASLWHDWDLRARVPRSRKCKEPLLQAQTQKVHRPNCKELGGWVLKYFTSPCYVLDIGLCTLHVTSVVSYSATPWDSPGKNTGVGCHALLQGIFPTQGLIESLSLAPSHWQVTSLLLAPSGKPVMHFQFSSVQLSCPTLCDTMNCSMPGLPVHHQLPEPTQTRVHWVDDAFQLSHPLSSPSPPALKLSQHQGLFKWVRSSHQVAKVLEFQLQHQSLQWIPRTDFL